jgi:hypothetical protein
VHVLQSTADRADFKKADELIAAAQAELLDYVRGAIIPCRDQYRHARRGQGAG